MYKYMYNYVYKLIYVGYHNISPVPVAFYISKRVCHRICST
jgi:hypothetical protein